jgi:glycosyltransferase involved in cell wall biosynthesis
MSKPRDLNGDTAVGGDASPLSIVLFSTSRVWGGAEEQTRLLATGLRDLGHHCGFVARRGSPVARRFRDDSFSVLEVSGTGRSPLNLWRVRRHLRRVRPNVLHYVDPHAVTCGGLASLGLKANARVAVRHNPFPLRSPARYRWLCDRIICVCDAVADVCRKCGLPGEMLRVVRNACLPASAVEPDVRTLRARFDLPQDDFVLLTAAALNECKGHQYLLKAMPAVLRHFPRARLVIAGVGPLEEPLRRISAELGIDSRVSFVGFRRDVRDWMRAADLFVLPSQAEGISAVLLEAMTERCPIVATEVGGTPELLSNDGQCVDGAGQAVAWLVPPARDDLLGEAIVRAARDGQERLERARRAEQRARAEYSLEKMVLRTLDVYRESGTAAASEGMRTSVSRRLAAAPRGVLQGTGR